MSLVIDGDKGSPREVSVSIPGLEEARNSRGGNGKDEKEEEGLMAPHEVSINHLRMPFVRYHRKHVKVAYQMSNYHTK